MSSLKNVALDDVGMGEGWVGKQLLLWCQKINVSYSFKKLRVTCQRLQLMVYHFKVVLPTITFLNSNFGINVRSKIQIVHKIGFAVLTKMSSN